METTNSYLQSPYQRKHEFRRTFFMEVEFLKEKVIKKIMSNNIHLKNCCWFPIPSTYRPQRSEILELSVRNKNAVKS